MCGGTVENQGANQNPIHPNEVNQLRNILTWTQQDLTATDSRWQPSKQEERQRQMGRNPTWEQQQQQQQQQQPQHQ